MSESTNSDQEQRAGIAGAIARAFIDSKLTPLVILTSVLLGVFSVLMLPREEEPQIRVPMIDVMVAMPGFSAREVEERATRPMEKLLWEIPGVEYVYSISRPGESLVIVRFEVGEDVERSLVKLNQKLQSNFDRIPPGVSLPLIKPKSIDDVPILALTFHSKSYDHLMLRRVVAEVEAGVKQVPLVAETTIIGGQRRLLRVLADPVRLASRGLSLEQLAAVLHSGNRLMPSGELTTGDREIAVETGGFLSNAEDVAALVVGVYGGRPVYLREVADVVDGAGDPEQYVLFGLGAAEDGGPGGEQVAVTLTVAKRPGSNAIAVADDVLAKVEALRGRVIPPGVEMTITRHYGETALEKSNELLLHMFIAVISVSLLILLVLGWRESVVVALAIPSTLALTLMVFYLFGYTLNRITLFALIFSIGILVDDAIVVVENIVRHFHLPHNRGRSATAIAIEAVGEVGNPTILATFAVIAAVLPMATVGGLMGPYMRPIPIGASAAMLFSLAIAFIVTPWASVRLLRGHDFSPSPAAGGSAAAAPGVTSAGARDTTGASSTRGDVRASAGAAAGRANGGSDDAGVAAGGALSAATATSGSEGTAGEGGASGAAAGVHKHLASEHEEDAFTRAYRRLMAPLISHVLWRWVFLVGITLLLLAACALVGLRIVKVKMLPFDNKNELQVILNMPEGSSLERSAHAAREIAAAIRTEPEVTDYQVYVGTASPYNFNGLVRHYFLRSGASVADIQVNLLGKHERSAQSHDIAKRIRPRVAAIAANFGARVAVAEVPPGPPVLQTLVAEAYGPTPEARLALAKKVKHLFARTLGVVDIDWYVEADQPKLTYVVDKEKAALHGIGTERLAHTLRLAVTGEQVGLLHDPDEKEDVAITVGVPQAERSNAADLLALRVPTESGALVPLGELVRMESSTADKSIYHKNLMPVTYVLGDVAGAVESPVYAISTMNEEVARFDTREFGGEGEQLPVYNLRMPSDDGAPALKWDGEWHITVEVFRDLGMAFAMVLVLIYALMVGWFGSFVTPLVVMAAIPFSLIGILPAHGALGAFFTATSMIGFMAGAGIVVRNSIILVDFIELRREEGMPLAESVVDAGAVRFRPMLLTALAVVVGAAVILFDPIFQGLAISLMAGEVASLLISRMAVPVLYYMAFARREAHAKG